VPPNNKTVATLALHQKERIQFAFIFQYGLPGSAERTRLLSGDGYRADASA
jgi:hypothetical protein